MGQHTTASTAIDGGGADVDALLVGRAPYHPSSPSTAPSYRAARPLLTLPRVEYLLPALIRCGCVASRRMSSLVFDANGSCPRMSAHGKHYGYERKGESV